MPQLIFSESLPLPPSTLSNSHGHGVESLVDVEKSCEWIRSEEEVREVLVTKGEKSLWKKSGNPFPPVGSDVLIWTSPRDLLMHVLNTCSSLEAINWSFLKLHSKTCALACILKRDTLTPLSGSVNCLDAVKVLYWQSHCRFGCEMSLEKAFALFSL